MQAYQMAANPLIDYIRHFATADEITLLAFQMETANHLDLNVMHMGRAQRLCRTILSILCQQRDFGQLDMTKEVIEKTISLPVLIKLVSQNNKDIDTTELSNYLLDLPCLTDAHMKDNAPLHAKTLEAHSLYEGCMKEKIMTLFHIIRPR